MAREVRRPFFALPLRFRTPFAILTAYFVFLQCPGLSTSFFLWGFACKFKQRGILGLPSAHSYFNRFHSFEQSLKPYFKHPKLIQH